MRTAVTLLIAALVFAGCPKAPPAPGPIPQGQPFTPATTTSTPPPPTTTTVPAPTPEPDGLQRAFTLAMPNRGWVYDFRWPAGVRLTSDRLEQGGTVRRLMSVGERGRLTLSVLFAPAPEGISTTAQLRDAAWDRLQIGNRFTMEETATFESGAAACGTYRVPSLRGIPENRRDVHCWLLHDGIAIHAWVTKSHATDTDLGRFRNWASSMRVTNATATAADRLLFGRSALGRDTAEGIDRALPHLEAAVAGWDTLTASHKLQLLAAAATAYLAKDRAPELLTLADRRLAELPTCAEAHYARAQALATLDRNEHAVTALVAAFVQAGAVARLPDPTEDSTFILLGDHPRFETLVARRAAQLAADKK
jgi:hypothetical protein